MEANGRGFVGHATERDPLTDKIIRCAIEVHRILGPGLLESAYQACLSFELLQLGLDVREQVPLPVVYKGVKLDCGYRMDLVVDHAVIVEVKTVDKLHAVHEAQLLSYLKLAGMKRGLLLNFHVAL